MTVDQLKEEAQEKIDDTRKRLDEIAESISNFRKAHLSKEAMDKELERIGKEIQAANEKIKDRADTLKDNVTSEFQTIIDSLKNEYNLLLSVGDKTPGDGTPSGSDTPSTDKEKGFFGKIGEWFGDQRKGLTSKEEWKNATWKNGLRAVGGVGLIGGIAWLSNRIFGDNMDYAAVIDGYEKMNDTRKAKAREEYYSKNIEGYGDMTDREKRKARRKLRKEVKKAERQKKRAERRDKFWKGGFGTFLKGLGIASLLGGSGYLIKKGLDKKKENDEKIESKMESLRGFESESKKLEEKADKCLELAHSSSSGVIDYRANLQEYEKILADVLNLQNEATKVYDEICNFRLENEIKTEADNLKNNIDGIVEKIKAMENEINESASPAGGNPSGSAGGFSYSGPTPRTPAEPDLESDPDVV